MMRKSDHKVRVAPSFFSSSSCPPAPPPPAYAEAASLTDITFPPASSSSGQDASYLPTIEQCRIHLSLLFAIHRLRQDIRNRNGLFGLNNEDIINAASGLHTSSSYLAKNGMLGSKENVEDAAIEAISEKRWACYVARATRRFEDWWLAHARTDGSRPIRIVDLVAYQESELATGAVRGNRWTKRNLPPLGEIFASAHSLSRYY